ncbi:hypothetical protein RSSM_06489 [Rhodopirellula sallentina SM41]|uniref:Uncharacterized protein n=1 Tax=Rhodopirellula sallentina SM41 TaxID=1263870 RepID=M5U814_9BACT|nr:hypothetical protein RSSM_06489 [Rhodopirellula sallentina SM41]
MWCPENDPRENQRSQNEPRKFWAESEDSLKFPAGLVLPPVSRDC